MTDTVSISRGDIGGPWRVAVPLANGSLPDLPGDYTCKLKVLGASIERTITEVGPDDDGTPNKRFIVYLTKAETTALTVGSVYRRVIQIENAVALVGVEDNLDFIVTPGGIDPSDEFTPPTEIDRLKAHREALLDAKDEAVMGKITEAWNGRYGNKAKYTTMTYDQICAALDRVDREIAVAESVAAGGSRRGHVGLIWNH